MAPASFPEIESPSLRKSGVVLGSEELRSSAIGPTSRDVGHATNLLNDEFLFDCDWRAENITFRETVPRNDNLKRLPIRVQFLRAIGKIRFIVEFEVLLYNPHF
jgi:hypothetical protein